MQDLPKVKTVDHSDHAVVYPRGYLNGQTGEALDTACNDLMREGQDRIIIDFHLIETINTTGIANLVSILEKVGRRNGTVCFSSLVNTNREIFDVLDISRAVLIFDTEEDARRHLRRRQTEGSGEGCGARGEGRGVRGERRARTVDQQPVTSNQKPETTNH
jgi:anti-anti-sigma factor